MYKAGIHKGLERTLALAFTNQRGSALCHKGLGVKQEARERKQEVVLGIKLFLNGRQSLPALFGVGTLQVNKDCPGYLVAHDDKDEKGEYL